MLTTTLCISNMIMTSLCRSTLRMLYLEVTLAMDNSLVRPLRSGRRTLAMVRRWSRLVGLVMALLIDDKIILQVNRRCKVKHQVDVVKKRAKT